MTDIIKVNIVSLFLLVFSSSSYAQKKIISHKDLKIEMIEPGMLIQNNDLDKFVGKYFWEEGDQKLVVEFSETEAPTRMGGMQVFIQMLMAEYKILRDGKNVPVDDKKFALMGGTSDDGKKVIFYVSNNKPLSSVQINLIYLDRDSLSLQKDKTSGDFNETDKNLFLLPLGIILKRIK